MSETAITFTGDNAPDRFDLIDDVADIICGATTHDWGNAREAAEAVVDSGWSPDQEALALLAGVLHENRAVVSRTNSHADGRLSFLGPMDLTKAQADAIEHLLAAENGRTGA